MQDEEEDIKLESCEKIGMVTGQKLNSVSIHKNKVSLQDSVLTFQGSFTKTCIFLHCATIEANDRVLDMGDIGSTIISSELEIKHL